MYVNENYTFTLNVSTGAYPVAKPSKAWEIQYTPQSVTIPQLDELQRQGKSFCYNFKEKDESGLITVHQKTLQGFDYTNAIFYDIDKMPITMEEYLSHCQFKPSLAYTTMSNGKVTDTGTFYGYRLLYVFDSSFSSIDEFDKMYFAIAAVNGFRQQAYPDGTLYEFDYRKVNQQYYGGGIHSESLRSDIVYTVDDFSSYFTKGEYLKQSLSLSVNKRKSPNKNNTKKKEEGITYYSEMDNLFYKDYFTLSPTKFIESYSRTYYDNYTQSLATARTLSDDGRYWVYPDDYVEVKRNWKVIDGKRQVVKWKDGNGRRKKLYVTAQIMKFNLPSISKEQLVFNLVYERFYYFDNSDNVLNNKTLIRIADNALENDFELSPCKHPKFSVNKDYWLRGDMTSNAAKNIIRKELKQKEVLSVYDFGLSVKENLKILKEKGMKVSRSYLFNLVKKVKENSPVENNIREEEEGITYYSGMDCHYECDKSQSVSV